MNHRPISIAVLLVAVAACSGDDDATPTTTIGSSPTIDSTTTAVESTLTTAATLTTTITTTSQPATTTTIEATTSTTSVTATSVDSDVDWRQVVEDLGQRRQDLYAAPDVARIPEVCGADTPCAEQLRVQLTDLAENDWRVVEGDLYTVLEARVEAFDGQSLETSLVVTLIVLVDRPESAGRIVDAGGEPVALVEPETPPGVRTENRTILARSGPTDDPWRIVSQSRIREVPE